MEYDEKHSVLYRFLHCFHKLNIQVSSRTALADLTNICHKEGWFFFFSPQEENDAWSKVFWFLDFFSLSSIHAALCLYERR